MKGYQPGGTNWKLGKGKPPLYPTIDLYAAYKRLWTTWAEYNQHLMGELAKLASENDYLLSDRFATTSISQARALAELLNEMHA